MALVLDTGVLIAALNERDSFHPACRALVKGSRDSLIIPVPVLVELEYFFMKFSSIRAWRDFCEDVNEGAYSIYSLDSNLLLEAARLQARYEDLPLGLVDAVVFATCEALDESKVATLDRRHFAILRTKEGKALELLPRD